METLSTKNYSMFKFRSDNRAAIMQPHVDDLIKSIQSNNLLDMRPILVNKEFEVIDGQHRLKAAQKLGVTIYYQVMVESKSVDIIQLNISRAWKSHDFLNYYVKNNFQEYVKLNDFINEHKISLDTCLRMTTGPGQNKNEFKLGKFKFKEDNLNETIIRNIHYTIDEIKRLNGAAKQSWLISTKFWIALSKIMSHPEFKMDQWLKKMKMHSNKLTAKVTTSDYTNMIFDIYNYKSKSPIDLD